MKQRIKVGLVQINSRVSNSCYLPYSVGILQSYVQKHSKDPDNYEFLLPIYSRCSASEAAQYLSRATIVAFSLYVWNSKLSLEIARKLKILNPKVTIICGGPQVPNKAENFLKKNWFVDLCCHGEGEKSFFYILDKLDAKDWENIPSISYLRDDNTFISNPIGERIQDLSTIPSPYLEGVFEPLIEAYPTEKWIALWETNRGCPFSCSYCDWGSATQSKVYAFDIDRLFKEIEWFASHKIETVYCCDANFGILPRDIEIAKYIAKVKKVYGFPKTLDIQSTKNATERVFKVQKILSNSGLNSNQGVTIAMQSLDPQTLKSINRHNISLKSYQELQQKFLDNGLQTYTDIIIGLPGETYTSFVSGISTLIEKRQHNRIPFNNLSILPNAEMADSNYQKKYGIQKAECEIINIHGKIDDNNSDKVHEIQQLVIATNNMSRVDWCKARTFAWMTALLHFDKLLQIPFVILHENYSISYKDLIEIFMRKDLDSFPILLEIKNFFLRKAESIQNNGVEYCPSKEWLNIWWPVDEYLIIKLSIEEKLENFYVESELILFELLEEININDKHILHESILLNKALFKQPFMEHNVNLNLSYNIWEFYQSALCGKKILLEEKPCSYYINRTNKKFLTWEEWYKEVIWDVSKGHIDQNKTFLWEIENMLEVSHKIKEKYTLI